MYYIKADLKMDANLKKSNEEIFQNEFNAINEDFATLEIRERNNKTTCLIWSKRVSDKSYNRFVLAENEYNKTVCDVTFHASSISGKYIPRLTFRKINKRTGDTVTYSRNVIIISFNEHEDPIVFWKFINFLSSYKELVDLGEFKDTYSVQHKDDYIKALEGLAQELDVNDLKKLLHLANLNDGDRKALLYEARKNDINVFWCLLKNIDDYHNQYKRHYRITTDGEEIIWHHFLKKNEWILGLNSDIKFVKDLYDEQKVGNENSSGSGSPKADFFGLISDYTMLVELKHSNTSIFKSDKSKGRADTWDFTSDFIEAISQCLAQKFALEKSFESKNFINENKRLRKDYIINIDPKSLLIIGNKKREFPIDEENVKEEDMIKNKTFERFRRNNRNIDIITFDELFERAYQIVYNNKLKKTWYLENVYSQITTP